MKKIKIIVATIVFLVCLYAFFWMGGATLAKLLDDAPRYSDGYFAKSLNFIFPTK